MSLKSEFLRAILMLLLGDGENQLCLIRAFDLSIKFLSKQKLEEDAFSERVKSGNVTLGELIEFQQSRVNSIYCLSCLEEIKKDSLF